MKKPSPLLGAVEEVLLQGKTLLQNISAEQYTRRLPKVFNSSVGGHYRHCLDHFCSLLAGLDRDEINYDHRARDLRIEKDLAFALAETERILRACASIPMEFLRCPINVRSSVSYSDAEAPAMESTVGRELIYAVAHAIHHYALIAVMGGLLHVRVPNGFGIAPSTLQHHREQPKAA